MYKKVLVPFDDSEPARRALQSAMNLVSGVDDPQVTVLNVVEWHDYNAETFKIASRMSGVLGDSLDMNAISEIGDIVGDVPYVDIAIVNGSPHDTIVAYANDLDYDCIAMGHRGMGVIRGMLGSVAYSVLQKANKPVLVVK